ncbi:MAG TPA: Ig-like domain repeat protein [Actinomycetota bacterium]|nr:Ig-like domain repeat protein [Actinomycetota bacterium]
MRSLRTAVCLAVAAASLSLPGSVRAAVSSPSPGATVRGAVAISENEGGTKPFYCGSDGLDSTITVRRVSDSAVVHQASKGSGGGWTTTWTTHGLPIGAYRIVSVAASKNGTCSVVESTLSDFQVTLENFSSVTYTGETNAGIAFPFTASARLVDQFTGLAIQGRSVTFSIGETPVGNCVTGADGRCSTRASAVASPGSHTIKVSFAGDCCWRSSSSTATLTVTPLPPCIVDPVSCVPA